MTELPIHAATRILSERLPRVFTVTPTNWTNHQEDYTRMARQMGFDMIVTQTHIDGPQTVVWPDPRISDPKTP